MNRFVKFSVATVAATVAAIAVGLALAEWDSRAQMSRVHPAA